jgi:CII-binding regulator of phage lambda lysogenization HflD
MQEEDPAAFIDSNGINYMESLPFDRLESDDQLGLNDLMDGDLSSIRPDDFRMREMNRQLRDQINFLSAKLNNATSAKLQASAKVNVLEQQLSQSRIEQRELLSNMVDIEKRYEATSH